MRNLGDLYGRVGDGNVRRPSDLHKPGIGDSSNRSPIFYLLIFIAALVGLRWLWEKAS